MVTLKGHNLAFAIVFCLLCITPCLCFKTHHNFLNIQRNSWRLEQHSNKPLALPLKQRRVHLLHTDASGSVGGGYYLEGQSYAQFKWSSEEKDLYGASGHKFLEKTDIRVLEFVTAVLAIYTERVRLQNSLVELRIDNSGAWKWFQTRQMSHLWGCGWMRLLEAVCKKYKIEVTAVLIHGKENPVADALSRYKTPEHNRVDLSMLQGTEQMWCPDAAWRKEIWRGRGRKRDAQGQLRDDDEL